MADSKLEIYQINLGSKSFRDIICENNKLQNPNERDAEDLFLLLYRRFLSLITQNAAWTSDATKLGLSLFSNDGENVNTILSSHAEHNLIEGFIDGGAYDQLRTIAQTDNVSDREQLGRNKMVADRYYFYMYCPIDSNIGLVFLERKKRLDIHTVVILFLKELLKNNSCKVKIDRFIPRSVVEEYKHGAVVDSFLFMDNIITGVLDGEGNIENEKRCGVTVKISLPEDDRPHYNNLHNILQRLGNVILKSGDTEKPLIDFVKKRGSLKKEDKKYTFNIQEDLKIKPTIIVSNELQDEERSILIRSEIKNMCDEILETVKPNVYPVLL